MNEFLTHLLEYIHQQLKIDEKSIISDLFDGILCHDRICPNGHSFQTLEIFRTLTLQFPKQVIYIF